MKVNETAAEKVLGWIEEHIESNQLQPGDSLPAELEIAEVVGVGRSSVREALTALKALGIIRTRRKGGITIIREPVLLRLRPFFAQKYTKSKTMDTAMEFRAMLEWGAAEQIFSQIKQGAVRKLRKILNDVTAARNETPDIFVAEQVFHTILLQACGNRLTELMAFIIQPVFERDREQFAQQMTPEQIDAWLTSHIGLVSSLENKDKKAFIEAMVAHTKMYMNL